MAGVGGNSFPKVPLLPLGESSIQKKVYEYDNVISRLHSRPYHVITEQLHSLSGNDFFKREDEVNFYLILKDYFYVFLFIEANT